MVYGELTSMSSENLDYINAIHFLYKHINDGWSVSVSEARANLKYSSQLYRKYRLSEHYERVRKISKGRRSNVTQSIN